jgi:hypothetical protein
MILRVTLKDCGAKIADYMESKLTHDELREWARDAMMAMDIPREEYAELMTLLQDISASTPENLRNAIKNYKKFTSPLVQGLPKQWLQ